MTNGIKIRNAFLAGVVPAVLEGLLVYFADPAVSNWVLAQSIIFWFGCGFVCYLSDITPNKVVSSVLLTVLLNVPWYIALTVVANRPEHLMPLVIASLIMGTIIGLISRWLNRSKNKKQISEII